MVQGWPVGLSPALILGKVITAVKAEELITRSTGKRKAIVLSFRTPKEKNAAVGVMRTGGIRILPVCSARSNSNPYHRIRTHWSAGESRRG